MDEQQRAPSHYQKEMRSWADDASLAVVARLSMIAAVFFFLPLCGWLVLRGVQKVDETASKVDSLSSSVQQHLGRTELIQQRVISLDKVVGDHEVRIRVLERPKVVQ
jgi:hypothetical protein